jgi:hypothetical protein
MDQRAPNYKPLMMIIGGESIAFDNGIFNNFGNFPIVTCGPLDFDGQCKGGPFSHGSFQDAHSQFCIFNTYVDNKSNNMCIAFISVVNAYDRYNETIAIRYDTCHPELFPARVNQKCPIMWTEKLLNGFIMLIWSLLIFFIFYVLIFRCALKTISFQKLKKFD